MQLKHVPLTLQEVQPVGQLTGGVNTQFPALALKVEPRLHVWQVVVELQVEQAGMPQDEQTFN